MPLNNKIIPSLEGIKKKVISSLDTLKGGISEKIAIILTIGSITTGVLEKTGVTNFIPEGKDKLTEQISKLQGLGLNSKSIEEIQKTLGNQLTKNGDNWNTRKEIEEEIKQLKEFETILKEFEKIKLPQESNETINNLIQQIPEYIRNNEDLSKLRKQIEEELEKQKKYLDDNFMDIGNFSIRDMVEKNINFKWKIDNLFYNKFFDIFTIEYVNFMGQKGYSLEDLNEDKTDGLSITPYELRVIVNKCAKSISNEDISKQTIKVRTKSGEIELNLINLKYVYAVEELSHHTMQGKSIRSFFIEQDGEKYIVEIDENDRITRVFNENNKIINHGEFQVVLMKNGKKVNNNEDEKTKTRNGANTEYEITINGKKGKLLAEGYKNKIGKLSYQTPYTTENGEEEKQLRQEGMNYLVDLVLQAQSELKNKKIEIKDPHLTEAIIISIIEHIDGDRELSDEELKLQMDKVLYILGTNGINAYQYGNSSVASGLTQFTEEPYKNLTEKYKEANLNTSFTQGTAQQDNIMKVTLLYLEDTLDRIKKQGIFPDEQLEYALGSDYNGGPFHAKEAIKKQTINWWENIENNENRNYVNKYIRVKQILESKLKKLISKRKQYFENLQRTKKRIVVKGTQERTIVKGNQKIKILFSFLTQKELTNIRNNYPNLIGNVTAIRNERDLMKNAGWTAISDNNDREKRIRNKELKEIKDTQQYIIGDVAMENRYLKADPTTDVLEFLSRKYFEKFKEPLVINSLIRTDEFARNLAGRNGNASRYSAHRISAFDIKILGRMDSSRLKFICELLSKMDKAGIINGILEVGNQKVLHITVLPESNWKNLPQNFEGNKQNKLEFIVNNTKLDSIYKKKQNTQKNIQNQTRSSIKHILKTKQEKVKSKQIKNKKKFEKSINKKPPKKGIKSNPKASKKTH